MKTYDGCHAADSVAEPVNPAGQSPLGNFDCTSTSCRYAKIVDLRAWIPEVDPEHPRARTFNVKLHERRTMLILQSSIASIFGVVTLSLMAWAIHKYPLVDDTGTFLTGDCRTVEYFDTFWHVALNVTSTLFLGAGNYCMQILVSPTRRQAEKAHKEGTSMEVGIQSFRNLARISYRRRVLWVLLGISSTTMHLFWNSALFSSIPFTVYPVAIVTSDFQDATDNWADFQSTQLHDASSFSDILALREKAKTFTRFTNRECIESHIDPRYASAELILVADRKTSDHIPANTNHTHTTSLINGWEVGYGYRTWNGQTNWVCDGLRKTEKDFHENWTQCTRDWILPNGNESDPVEWTVYQSKILYCLQGDSANNDERCSLHFSKTIFIIISFSIVAEAALICTVAYISLNSDPKSEKKTMVTLGDAQAEFLENLDECPAESQRVEKDTKNSGKHFAKLGMAKWKPTRQFWLTAIGPKMFITTVALMLAAICLGFILFGFSLVALRRFRQEPTLRNIWRSGVGRINYYMLIGGPLRAEGSHTQIVVGHVLFANIFQLIISMIYLLFNNCLTCQVLADNWTRFMSTPEPTALEKKGESHSIPNRKTLRVSSHVGMQRTSYMLSLPWTYAAPMMLAFTILHTMVARSVFLVRTSAYTAGSLQESHRVMLRDSSRVGFSCMGILISTVLGLIMLIGLVANSFRSYRGVPEFFPRLANKTAFIKAMCQRPQGDEDAYLFPVAFMAVDSFAVTRDGKISPVQRLALSTDRYGKTPEENVEYEQALPVNYTDDWEAYRNLVKNIRATSKALARHFSRSKKSL